MDRRTVVRKNGMAKVLRTTQLGIESGSTLRGSALPTPAPEPAHAFVGDEGVDTARLDAMLGQMDVTYDLDHSAPANEERSPYPHIFAIGDAADAFGAINAGHTAYYQVRMPNLRRCCV